MSAGHPIELEPLYGDYPLDQAFDEMREPTGELRAHYRAMAENLATCRRVSCSGASSRRTSHF